MTFRRRNDHTWWRNEEPLKDIYAVLAVLRGDSSSTEPYYLRRGMINGVMVWEIVMPWYRSGSSGADSWGEEYCEVDSAIAEQLKTEGFLVPHVAQSWGFSVEQPDKLVITGSAKSASYDYDNSLRATARSLLVPGQHTDLAGTIRESGSGREEYVAGRFYVDFITPQEDICRVYPDNGEIVWPYPPPEPEEQEVA